MEHIKQLVMEEKQKESLRKIVQGIINTPNVAPSELFTSRLICIPKKSGGLRPLCVEETVLKVVNKIINASITPYILKAINPMQTCLCGSNAQMNAVEVVKKIITENKDGVFIQQLDMSDAFGSVEHKYIIEELQKIKGIERQTCYIATLLKRMKLQYTNEKQKLKERNITRGVPQGDPLSMTLFSLALNRAVEKVFAKMKNKCNANMVAYADDVILVAESEEEMNKMLELFEEEVSKIGLKLNPGKTKKYTTCKKDSNEYQSLHKCAMEYLGIPISLNEECVTVASNSYLEKLYKEAKMLWNVKGLSIQVKYHMYQTCVLSKLVYFFRGTDIKKNVINMSTKIETLYKKHFPIPSEIMRLPVALGGMGLLFVDDIRQISRVSYLIETGRRKVPDSLKGYIDDTKEKETVTQRVITKAYYRKQKEVYIGILRKNNTDKNILQMLDDNQSRSAHCLLISPPSNHTQVMDDLAFRLCIALRYHVDIVQNAKLKCEKCNNDNTLWHILRCKKENMKNIMKIHNKIKSVIGEMLKRNKDVINIKYEEKPTEDNNGDAKIPDIVISLIDGREVVLDISIEGKFHDQHLCGYEPTKGMKMKKKQYSGYTSEVHPIILDNSGRINTESWNFLKEMGMKNGTLKYIQALIMKNNSDALRHVSKKCIDDNSHVAGNIGNIMQIAIEGLYE